MRGNGYALGVGLYIKTNLVSIERKCFCRVVTGVEPVGKEL